MDLGMHRRDHAVPPGRRGRSAPLTPLARETGPPRAPLSRWWILWVFAPILLALMPGVRFDVTTAGAASSSPMWGIDALDNVQQDGIIPETQTALGALPQFVGQYLIWGGETPLTSTDAQYIQTAGSAVLLIDSPNQQFTNPAADAQAAIAQAETLEVPAGAAIFRDVEAGSPITSSYIVAYYDAFLGSEYAAGFYENPGGGTGQPFNGQYCAAVSQNAAIAAAPLYSSEPELESYTPYASQAPAWAPETPSCANTTVAWQYLERGVNSNSWPGNAPSVDVDEFQPADQRLLWGAGDPGVDAVSAVRGINGTAWALDGVDSLSPVFGGSWANLSGAVLESPAVVSVPTASGAGQPLYLATGANHDVDVSLGGGTWAGLSAVPVYCTDAPAATVVAATPGSTAAYTLVVACRGIDGALWWVSGPVTAGTLPSRFSGWTSLGGLVATGTSGAPAVTAVKPSTGSISFANELTFFVNGMDGRVWETTASAGSGGWATNGWICSGHLAAGSFVASGAVTSAFACQGADRAVWAATTTGTSWDLQRVGGIATGGPGIALSPTSWTIVVEGTDGGLWQDTSTITTGSFQFGGWSPGGGSLTNGAEATALLTETNNP